MTENKRNTFNPITVLRFSIGIIYLWFGVLKLFYGLSPAEHIASQTIHQLTFGLLPDRFAIDLLAIWECCLGVMLLVCKWMKTVLLMMFVHMAFTFTPFLFFPHQTFNHLPYDFTLLGQYIMKNIIVISGGLVLWRQYVQHAPVFLTAPSADQK